MRAVVVSDPLSPMTKLSAMPSALLTLGSAIGYQRDAHGHSKEAEPWRAWYSLAEWKRLRLKVFKRDQFTCQCGCGVSEARTINLVADHVRPHRGDKALFWDEGNIQTLRKVCHDSRKQAEERRAPWQGGRGWGG